MVSWPDLGGPHLAKGTYYVAYPSPGDFYEPDLKGDGEFRSLESAIFEASGAIAILRGEYKPRNDRRNPTHVVIYRGDTGDNRLAIAVRPKAVPAGNEFEAALFRSVDLQAYKIKGAVVQRPPGRVIDELWSGAIEVVTLTRGQPGSYPAGRLAAGQTD